MSILSHAVDFAPTRFYLESICLPSSIERIPKSCFNDGEKLSNVTAECDGAVSILGDFWLDEDWSDSDHSSHQLSDSTDDVSEKEVERIV
jgi:hypothetical protein